MDNLFSGIRSWHIPAAARLCPEGITIVIPNWNHEFFLPRSIDSAWQASRLLIRHGVPSEILIIDNNSRDGSVTLLRQLEALMYDAGVRVLASTENRGPTWSRHFGLHQASYRYVIFLDADNELLSANAFHFYRAMVQTRAAVVYGNVLHYQTASDEITLLSQESFQFRAFRFRGNYIDTLAMLDRLQLLDAGGFTSDSHLPIAEDWALYLHLAASGRKLVFVPLVFGIYYDLPSSRIQEFKQRAEEGDAYLHRVYSQSGIREQAHLNTLHLRYHPDIGYL